MNQWYNLCQNDKRNKQTNFDIPSVSSKIPQISSNSLKVLDKALNQPKFCPYYFSHFQKVPFLYATDDSNLSLN